MALFLYLVRSILPPFFVGGVLAYVLGPVVAGIEERWRLPRPISVLLLYLAIVGPLVVVVVYLGPPLFTETHQFAIRAPLLLERTMIELFGPGPYNLLGTSVGPKQLPADLFESLRQSGGTPGAALRAATAIFGFLLRAFLSLIISVYLLIDSRGVNHALMRLVPSDRRDEVTRVSEEINQTLARYIRRQILLVGLVSGVTFAGLELIFHLRYALPLAVATGFLEIVPFVGPVAAGTIAALVALSQSGTSLMLGVIVFYVVVRQIEDQLVMPLVLGRAIALHPIVVIFAVLAGGALAGVIGTLLAVPVAAAIKVVLDAWPRFMPRSCSTVPPPAAEFCQTTLPPRDAETQTR